METQAPSKHPVLTLRQVVVELAIVTMGVVIALSFDAVRQFVDHRQLVAEARENMLNELGRNKVELDRALEAIGQQRREYRRTYDVIVKLIDGKPSEENLNLNLASAALSFAAYSSAQATGAFGYMDYDEVRRFTGLYDAQGGYLKLQDRLGEEAAGLSGLVLLGRNPEKASRSDLEVIKRQIEVIAGTLFNQQQLGKYLSGQYDTVLKEKKKE